MNKTNIITLVIKKAVDGKLNVEEATEIINGLMNKCDEHQFINPTYPSVTPNINPFYTNPYDPYKVTCSATNNI